ncbi:cilia- and flagella-associated protein 52-like [Mytilus californianus]|uniref:cilia- and flagella-associated protein 52-like n=1 Tax=Mytilus californianus TaxID=6549 RepID=UPI002247E9E1|nr:cilia- and flagella-associated protein 52-like [Mytilus californianus]
MTDTPIDVPRLELDSIIGFNGDVNAGLKVHPGREHLIYPLGNTVIIEHVTTKEFSQLSGHTNNVSCIAVSPSGNYLASGQVTHMGFKANVIIWDFHRKQQIATLSLHKVKVQDLAFSPNEKYLVTLGGQDDGSVVVWDLASKEAICGNQAQVESAGVTYCVAYSNVSDDVFVTGGDGTLRVWELDVGNRKIKATNVVMGQLKRVVKCIQMADHMAEPFFFCGTTTGDIIGINMRTRLFQVQGPKKELFSKGVTSLALLKSGDFLVGAGDGEVALAKFYKKQDKGEVLFEKKRSWKDKNLSNLSSPAITSVALRGDGHQFYVGAANSQIYRFNYAEYVSGGGDQKQINKKTGLKIEKKTQTDDKGVELVKTCHSKAVKDVVFPFGFSNLIVTCQEEEIRVWNMSTKKEILRHVVANKTCNAVCITRDGKTIFSAWDDGIIRGYGFSKDGKSLKQKFERGEAHSKGVTAISCTSDGNRIVSGGGEGQVRIWDITRSMNAKGEDVYIIKLAETMMEHKGTVSDVKVTNGDLECATASNDGTCIIWDLQNKRRKGIVFANTLFKCLTYDAKEVQLVTSGTDRKIGFWETHGGERIRDLDGSSSGSVNAIDLSPDGRFLVTGGDDRMIKVWTYQEGEVVAVGIGHSDSVIKVKICPNQNLIVSVSEDGAILIWKFPFTPRC